MRPNPTEALKAIQGAVAEYLAPEISSLFAVEATTAITMLCESLAAEADTLAEDLANDNAALRVVLASGRESLARNTNAASLVSFIDGVLSEDGGGRIAVSVLSEVNDRLNEALARLLEHTEMSGEESLAEARRAAYHHLRRVAVRGWSYFDVSGFRQRIVEARAEVARNATAEGI
jgi:hypothetical protein